MLFSITSFTITAYKVPQTPFSLDPNMSRLPTQIISSGEYAVTGDIPSNLTAILGSCVGIALYDKKNKVGGLFHILLPEPPTDNFPADPMVYASTGLPLFINKLLENGAEKKYLRAVIAGGALIGQVSPQDLTFDIGGRTSEIVSRILSQEDIPIEESETGGYFGGKLKLNSSTGETEITSASPMPTHGETHFSPPQAVDIDRIIEKIRPVPQAVLKILRLISQEDYNMKNIADEICQDQVIGAKILRYCNSMIIGMKDVDSLDRAVIMLGEAGLLEVVLSMTIDTYFIREAGGYSLQKGGLHHHSLAVANCAKVIANHTGRINPTTAYTAGLFHDIGKIVLDQFVSDAAPLFYKNLLTQRKNFTEQEREILGTDHQEVGKKLALKWQLADSLVECIEFHDCPGKAEKQPELVHITYIANLLATSFQAEADIETGNGKELETRLDRIGMKAAELPGLISRVPWGKRI